VCTKILCIWLWRTNCVFGRCILAVYLAGVFGWCILVMFVVVSVLIVLVEWMILIDIVIVF